MKEMTSGRVGEKHLGSVFRRTLPNCPTFIKKYIMLFK